jgi:nucleotide-binding universal stress UspA family protein
MYNTILVAVALQRWERYSAHALATRNVAAAFAKATSKQLYILSAYEYEYIRTTIEMTPEMLGKLREESVRRTDNLMVRKLDEYVAPLLAEGIVVSKILRNGNPREVIVQVATNIKADLLIIGSHSKRGLVDISLGGTAQHVSRHAPCTVVLVSPEA